MSGSANTVSKLRRRAAAGEDIEGKRGTVRLGKAITQQFVEPQNYDEWTMEELRRGRRAQPPGSDHFQGPDPQIVHKDCAKAFTARVFSEAEAKLRAGIPEAVDMLNAIITGADTKDADRLKAIEMILNRTMGREALRVDVHVEAPWMQVMADSIVAIDEPTDIIDVDSTEG